MYTTPTEFVFSIQIIILGFYETLGDTSKFFWVRFDIQALQALEPLEALEVLETFGQTLQALREKDTGDDAASEDDLLEVISGRYHDKNVFFGQDDDWNNVIEHLLPSKHAFHSSDEDECPPSNEDECQTS